MTDRNAVMAEHGRNVGWRESGVNHNQWGAEQGVGDGYAYCDSAASMVPWHNGLRWWSDCTFRDKGCAYTVAHVDVARAHGLYVEDHASKGQPAPLEIGDVVMFDWNGSGGVDHAETVSGLPQGATGAQWEDIGYNTGSPEGCWRVLRDRKYLHGVIKMAGFYSVVPTPTPAPSPTPVPAPAPHPGPLVAPPFPLPAGYYFGPRTGPVNSVSGYFSHSGDLVRWQQRMHDRGWTIAVDGHFGDGTAAVATQFQIQKHLGVDGHIGPQTWAAAWTAPVT